MSRVYVTLLLITAASMALTGATFSIVGLAKIFSGASTAVIFMAAALELAKLVMTGFLYRYWGHVPLAMRNYLLFAVATLVVITSIGIYGFLSNAYQVSSLQLHGEMMTIQAMESENQRIQDRVKELRRFVDEIPNNRISRKFEYQNKYEPRIRVLQTQSERLVAKITAAKQDILNTQAEVGPVSFLANALHVDIDTIVKFLILAFVLVFDPLAICLVYGLNLVVRLREKYRDDEARISDRSIASPVDHRFKNAS